MRINEGRALEKDFLERLNRITRYIDEIRSRTMVIVESYRDKLIQRINKLIKAIEINEDRIIQEVALMADKADITEELIRVESHLEQVLENFHKIRMMRLEEDWIFYCRR